MNSATSNVYSNAVETYDNAQLAAAAALTASAPIWVSGTTYAIGDARFSPIDLKTYRRRTTGAGTTDPSADPTNWQLVAIPISATIFYDSGTTNALNFNSGICQRWAPSTGAQTLSITNWPASGNLGELLIEGINLGAATITWPTINWVKSDGSTTTTFASNGVTLQASGTDWVLLWTRNGGTTVYGKIMR